MTAIDTLQDPPLPVQVDAERSDVAAALAAIGAAEGAFRGVSARRGERIDPRAITVLCGLDDVPAVFEAALGWDAAALPPFASAALAWILSTDGLRDVALVQWCDGLPAGDEALAARLRDGADGEDANRIAACVWGEGARPSARRLERALDVLDAVASSCPAEFRVGLLAAASWISWALGRTARAARYAADACAIDPENALAEIVQAFVALGHVPDWAIPVR